MTSRVLVADDEPDILDLTVTVLRRVFDEVIAVPSGTDAFAALQTQRFNVAVLDERMPGMTGTEILHALHREGVERPPVLLLTANAMRTMVEAAHQAKAEDLLTRPFSIHELVGRVEALAGGTR